MTEKAERRKKEKKRIGKREKENNKEHTIVGMSIASAKQCGMFCHDRSEKPSTSALTPLDDIVLGMCPSEAYFGENVSLWSLIFGRGPLRCSSNPPGTFFCHPKPEKERALTERSEKKKKTKRYGTLKMKRCLSGNSTIAVASIMAPGTLLANKKRYESGGRLNRREEDALVRFTHPKLHTGLFARIELEDQIR
jgi:hypothetical protein